MIRLAEIPRYFLIAESELESFQGQTLGRWRFVLQSAETADRFDASDWEPGVSLERLELLTVIRGLEELDQPSHVTIVTDSKCVLHGFGFGLRQWRHNGWQWEQFGDLVPITNADLWRRIDRASQFHQIQCRHREAGEALNERRIATPYTTIPPATDEGDSPQPRLGTARRWMRNLTRVASSIIPI